MSFKRYEHLSHHHLGDSKVSTRLQDIKTMPSLPPRKISYHHLPITKHSAKQKNQKFYPNAGMRTNIIFHALTYTHNPSNTTTIKKEI